MKTFKSFLARHLEHFIQYRRDVGYVNRALSYHFKIFDRYVLENAKSLKEFKPVFFLDFREQIPGTPSSVNNVVLTVRNFFDYLHRYGYIAYNPVKDLPVKTENAFIPFVFSPEQIKELLQAVQTRIRKDKEKLFLVDLGIYMAISLIAGCGLRISEPLKAELEHYDPLQGTIFIQKTKFHKDRLIPLPRMVQKELDNYLSFRRFVFPENPYLLPGFEQSLRNQQIYKIFHRAVQDIGIQAPRKVIGNMVFGHPTPHSLRHSFAVNTLKAAKERGQDPQKVLPVISAYMGHSKYRYTALYLKVLDAERRSGFVDFAISHLEDI